MRNNRANDLQKEMIEKSEDKIQQEIFMWFNNTFCLKHHVNRCLIFSVPNGGLRNKVEAIKLKGTGVLSGVSDLIVVVKNKTIFIEVKATKGVQSNEQIDFETRVKELGFNYHIVRSLEDFKLVIENLTK